MPMRLRIETAEASVVNIHRANFDLTLRARFRNGFVHAIQTSHEG